MELHENVRADKLPESKITEEGLDLLYDEDCREITVRHCANDTLERHMNEATYLFAQEVQRDFPRATHISELEIERIVFDVFEGNTYLVSGQIYGKPHPVNKALQKFLSYFGRN